MGVVVEGSQDRHLPRRGSGWLCPVAWPVVRLGSSPLALLPVWPALWPQLSICQMDALVGSSRCWERQPGLLQAGGELEELHSWGVSPPFRRRGLWPGPACASCLDQGGASVGPKPGHDCRCCQVWGAASGREGGVNAEVAPPPGVGLPPEPSLPPAPRTSPTAGTLPSRRPEEAGGAGDCAFAHPPEPGARCSEQLCPSASQTGKSHPRVTKQLSAQQLNEREMGQKAAK